MSHPSFQIHRTLYPVTLATILVALTVTSAVAGSGLETFVMATHGQSTTHTFRQPDPVFNNFPGFGYYVPSEAISDPTLLGSVGVSGLYRVTSSAVAPSLTDATSTAGAGVSNFGGWNFTGSTSVTARYGQLKSQSQAVHTGNSDNHTINTAESYGIFRESFIPTSPTIANGTAGTMKIAMTIDGTLSVSGTGTAGLVFRYGYGNDPSLDFFLLETYANIYGNGYQIHGVHSSYGSFLTPPGMTLNFGPLLPSGAPTFITFGGTTTVHATIPILFGASFDYRMGLQTFTTVGNGNGTMATQFADTATMTGIQLFDAQGNPVNDFSITSGSGTFYDANGVRLSAGAAAPEPATLGLIGFIALLGGVHRLRRRGCGMQI